MNIKNIKNLKRGDLVTLNMGSYKAKAYFLGFSRSFEIFYKNWKSSENEIVVRFPSSKKTLIKRVKDIENIETPELETLQKLTFSSKNITEKKEDLLKEEQKLKKEIEVVQKFIDETKCINETILLKQQKRQERLVEVEEKLNAFKIIKIKRLNGKNIKLGETFKSEYIGMAEDHFVTAIIYYPKLNLLKTEGKNGDKFYEWTVLKDLEISEIKSLHCLILKEVNKKAKSQLISIFNNSILKEIKCFNKRSNIYNNFVLKENGDIVWNVENEDNKNLDKIEKFIIFIEEKGFRYEGKYNELEDKKVKNAKIKFKLAYYE